MHSAGVCWPPQKDHYCNTSNDNKTIATLFFFYRGFCTNYLFKIIKILDRNVVNFVVI